MHGWGPCFCAIKYQEYIKNINIRIKKEFCNAEYTVQKKKMHVVYDSKVAVTTVKLLCAVSLRTSSGRDESVILTNWIISNISSPFCSATNFLPTANQTPTQNQKPKEKLQDNLKNTQGKSISIQKVWTGIALPSSYVPGFGSLEFSLFPLLDYAPKISGIHSLLYYFH